MMLFLHVPDLVREHAGELRLVLENPIQSAGDEYIAAWRGECIDVTRLDHAEGPVQVGPRALLGNPASDFVYVLLQFGILDERRRAEQIAGDLSADLAFVLD